MKIRGAPAIASLASLSLASYLSRSLDASPSPPFLASPAALRAHVHPILDHLYSSRPTAVNLGAAIRRLSRILDEPASREDESYTRELAAALIKEGRLVADEDVGRNHEMSRHGAEWVFKRSKMQENGKVNVLTVCNTGSLATSVSIRSDHQHIFQLIFFFCRRDMELLWVSLATCMKRANLKRPTTLKVHPTTRALDLPHSSCNPSKYHLP